MEFVCRYLDLDVKEIIVVVKGIPINLRHVGGIHASDVGSIESRQSAKWSVQLLPDRAL